MPRATTKQELAKSASEQFDKLWSLIDSMTEKQKSAVFQFDLTNKKEAHWSRDQNLRDVLIHLYEWHQLLLNWVQSNQSGDKKPFLPEPYNWKTYGQMNMEFFEKHQSTSLEQAKAMLMDSHHRVAELIDTFSDEELFEKKHFSWTGTSSVGSYCISVTTSHYDWAIKKLKAHLKSQRGLS